MTEYIVVQDTTGGGLAAKVAVQLAASYVVVGGVSVTATSVFNPLTGVYTNTVIYAQAMGQ